jgi:hypothetical protein
MSRLITLVKCGPVVWRLEQNSLKLQRANNVGGPLAREEDWVCCQAVTPLSGQLWKHSRLSTTGLRGSCINNLATHVAKPHCQLSSGKGHLCASKSVTFIPLNVAGSIKELKRRAHAQQVPSHWHVGVSANLVSLVLLGI